VEDAGARRASSWQGRALGSDGSSGSRRVGRSLAIEPREPLSPTADEPAIVEAVLAGDRDAFRLLVDREASAVVRACHRILGDLHEAEDAAQEAFVICFRSLSTWRREGSFGAWLGRIAVRVALRQAGKRKAVSWLEPGGSSRSAAVDPVSPLPDPAAIAIHGERSASVRSAVAALDEPYREVVALRFFAEQSLAEIAEHTGRPVGTVKTHLHRGLLRLRDRLSGDER
jgi:RNA polymerase sigma-70 factor (ECF subfamily)